MTKIIDQQVTEKSGDSRLRGNDGVFTGMKGKSGLTVLDLRFDDEVKRAIRARGIIF